MARSLPFATATVAILDTGVDASHPDLAGVLTDTTGTSVLDGSNGRTDPNGHGTNLAGIVAAAPNTMGIAGVGYSGVRIMPVTVLAADGTGQDSDIIAGVMYAVDHGADVILMGFSNPGDSQLLQDAIDYAWSQNVVLVAATGNDASSTPTYPAGDHGVIGVSATDLNDNLAFFSNYGPDVFVAAPGTDILTTDLNGNYVSISGTSASAAIVAGVAAFQKAVDMSLSNGVIVGRLASTADPAGTTDQTGNGRVNMARALSNTGIDPIEPIGAPGGGPIVGPYTVATAKTITGITVGAQTGTLTFGVKASATYLITLTWSGGHSSSATMSISGLPAGATGSFSPNPVPVCDDSTTTKTTLTVTTNNPQTTPAGTSLLTISQNTSCKTGTASLVINGKSNQTITVTTPAPATAAYNSTFTVAAIATSGLPVSYSSAGGCTNVGATFTMTSSTTACTVQYDQAGDANYSAAPQVTSSTAANKSNQTITVTTPAPATAAYNSTFTVAATASSGLAVSYSSAGGCTNVGATFTMTSSTTACTVQYDQAGDANYSAAPQVTSSTAADKANQTITVTTPAPATAAYNSTFTVAAIATSGLPVSYSSAGGCTNVGATFTMTSSTTACTVQYDQAGDANYSAAPQVTSSTTSGKANQTITVTTPAPATAAYNSTFTVAATASSGLAVSYSSAGGCTNVGATFTMTSGTTACTVKYDQAGDANYSAAPQVTSSTAANKANQTITVTTPAPATAAFNSTFTVAATASSGLAVSYSSAGGCTNVGATFTMTSGTTACTVKYDQAGDTNYSAAPQVTSSTAANKSNQTITVTTPAPATAAYNSTFTAAATASSGLAISYSSAGGCTNVGTTFTMTSSATACTVQYDQSGDANYNAAAQVTSSTSSFPPVPPIAGFNWTQDSIINYQINFDASISTGDGLIYAWDFGDGTSGAGATVAHQYNNSTAKNVTLTVTSSAGMSATRISRVIPAFKKSNLVVNTPDITVTGYIVSLTDHTTGGYGTVKVSVNWGDGRIEAISQGATVIHTFRREPIHPIRITATDTVYRRIVKHIVALNSVKVNPIPLSGIVTKCTNSVCSGSIGFGGVSVLLKKGTAIIKKVTTQADGTFLFPSVQPIQGVYTVSTWPKQGYAASTDHVDVSVSFAGVVSASPSFLFMPIAP